MTGKVAEYHIFLTHYHLDHVQGLPFFRPLFDLGSVITFYGPPTPEGDVRSALEGIMRPPWFPIPMAETASTKRFVTIENDPVEIRGVRVLPRHLPSPHYTTIYRIEGERASVVFVTDVESGDPAGDRALRDLAADADVLIHDAQYLPEEFPARKGWGHSTWWDAVKTARDARVGKLVLFHHDPERSDEEIARIVAEAAKHFPDVDSAREGMTIPI